MSADPDLDDGIVPLPPWLTTLAGASVLGVGLTDDPVGFVEAAIVSIVGGYIADIVGRVISLTELLFSTVISGLVTAFGPVLDPFGFIGDAILSLVGIYESILVDLSVAAGPFAPLVFVGAMVTTIVLAFAGARVVISLYLFIRGAII